MAQTGDVEYRQGRSDGSVSPRVGTGGSKLPDLPAEFSDVPFERGTVGMARAQNPNSANSQFFIMFAPTPHLNGQYTVVGQVVEGMENVDKIKRGSGQDGMVSQPDIDGTTMTDLAQRTVAAAQAIYGTHTANLVRRAFDDRGIL